MCVSKVLQTEHVSLLVPSVQEGNHISQVQIELQGSNQSQGAHRGQRRLYGSVLHTHRQSRPCSTAAHLCSPILTCQIPTCFTTVLPATDTWNVVDYSFSSM